MIAALDPTFQQVGLWLGCFAAIILILNQGIHFVRNLKDQPPTSELASMIATKYTSRPDFERHIAENKSDHEGLHKKIGGVERGGIARQDSATKEWRDFVETKLTAIQTEQNHSAEHINNRINQILEAVSELRGELRAGTRK